jgi:phage-related protein
METYLDQLKADFAPSTSLIPFYYKAPGVTERVLFVKPQGCKYDWDALRRIGSSRIQFKMFAEDPRIYDAELQSIDIPYAGAASTGFSFDLGFDFGFGAPVVGAGGTFVNNLGNRPTPPTFILTGPSSSPIIRDETHDGILQFAITLGASDTLTINTQYKTVRLNGSTNRRNVLQGSSWFYLPPGESYIRYSAGSGSGSTLTTQFRSAYR